MSLKENIKVVKEELSTEEKFLESAIKVETYFRKYKKLIYTLVIIILVLIIGIKGYNYKQELDLKKSNEDYNLLLTKGENKSLEEDLKNKNPKLYNLYLFQKAIKSNDAKSLKSFKTDDNILKSIVEYQASSIEQKGLFEYAGKHDILKDFAYLQAGFLELKNKNFQRANDIFSFISPTSTFYEFANDLKHYSK